MTQTLSERANALHSFVRQQVQEQITMSNYRIELGHYQKALLTMSGLLVDLSAALEARKPADAHLAGEGET